MLASCPSLGPLKIICRDDLDCPSPSQCVAGFCSEDGGGAGGGNAGGGGGAGGTGGGSAGGAAMGGGVGGAMGGGLGGASGGGLGGGSAGGTGGSGGAGGSGGSGGAGGTGGGSGGAGGGLGFCASLSVPPKFCADFDEPDADVDFRRWNGRSTADAGYVALDTQHVASGPRAMRATIAPNSGGCRYAIASMYLETDGGPQKARLALSGRWPDGGWTGPFAQLGLERFGTNAGLCQGILSAQNGEISVLEQGVDQGGANPYSHNHDTSVTLPRDAFARLELEYDLQSRRILLWLDGGLILDAGLQMPCPYGPATRIGIAAGFWCTPVQPTTRHAWFDDLTLDFQ